MYAAVLLHHDHPRYLRPNTTSVYLSLQLVAFVLYLATDLVTRRAFLKKEKASSSKGYEAGTEEEVEQGAGRNRNFSVAGRLAS